MRMVKTRIITDDKTKERFMMAFNRDGILVAFEKIISNPPEIPLETQDQGCTANEKMQ